MNTSLRQASKRDEFVCARSLSKCRITPRKSVFSAVLTFRMKALIASRFSRLAGTKPLAKGSRS